jgi:hypothetical protein
MKMDDAKAKLLKRVLPQVKLRDLDVKWLLLLGFVMTVTLGDDFVLPIFGTLLDFIELPVDVLVAMILSRNTIHRAAQREAETVQGKVVSDETMPEARKG